MSDQIAQSPTYRYHGRDWPHAEFAAAMACEAKLLATCGETCVFPAEDVFSWLSAMRIARLAAQDDAETFAF